MAVRVVASPSIPSKISYPWLGTDGFRVVLFARPGVGTVVGGGDKIASHHSTWKMEAFREYDGEITLSSAA